LQTLKLTLRLGIGALQAALRLPEPLEQRDLDFGGGFLRYDAFFGQLDTSEFPLRDGHLLDVELLGPGFWVAFGFEVVAELVEVVGVFAGQHDGAGAVRDGGRSA